MRIVRNYNLLFLYHIQK